MLGLIDLEIHDSIFNITAENNQFVLYKDPFDSDFSLTELKDKIGEVLGLSDKSPEELERETFGLYIIETCRKLTTEMS